MIGRPAVAGRRAAVARRPASARRRATAAVLTLALALTACAAPRTAEGEADAAVAQVPLSELTPLADPKGYEGPSTAVLADAAIEPVDSDATPRLPTTIVSRDLDGDVEMTVTDTSRVVAMDLAGSIAATVWGLGFGATLVGRDVTTTFPGTEDLPVVTGSGHTVNAEAIIALRPTLVLTDGTIGPIDVVEQLRDVGIPVVFVDTDASLDGAATLARDVAAAFGAPEAGELLAARLASEIDEVRTQIERLAPADPAERVRILFLYLRGTSGVYYLFGSESGADELIEGVTAIDVAGELGWTGMRPVTDEALVAADPDLILLMSHGLESVGGVDGLLEALPAVSLTAAGQQRRFVDMADGQLLSFGPRTAHVLEALARAIYAPESLS